MCAKIYRQDQFLGFDRLLSSERNGCQYAALTVATVTQSVITYETTLLYWACASDGQISLSRKHSHKHHKEPVSTGHLVIQKLTQLCPLITALKSSHILIHWAGWT